MAWRMPPPLPPSTPWDVLPASTTGGALGRILLRPLTSWSGATFSSLPLGFRGGCGGYAPGRPPSSTDRAFRWTPSPANSGAVESISTSGRPQAPAIRALGAAFVAEVVPPGRDLAFEPMLHGPPGVKLLPGWLTDLRRAAYRRSTATPRRRVTPWSGGSAASSAVVISGAFSRHRESLSCPTR